MTSSYNSHPAQGATAPAGGTASGSDPLSDTAVLELLQTARHLPARCGNAEEVFSPELRAWFRNGLYCLAGRREFYSGRYFAVDVQRRSDVLHGWRRFVEALEARSAVACLFVVSNPAAVLGESGGGAAHNDARHTVRQLAEVMAPLSDQPASALARGAQLNFVLHLVCPVTGVHTAFFDFDAVAFVPQAADRADPLYDPLMSAPLPMVNVSSDLYALAMYTRDHCRQRFDCELASLTRRERRYLFRYCADSWQRVAETTIRDFASQVDQRLCPTHLVEGGRRWLANHRDPAFAEDEKHPHLHDMPVLYAPRMIEVWERYFEQGVAPDYRGLAAAGETGAARCPVGAAL